MISNISRNPYTNFSAILNSTTQHNKSKALIFLTVCARLIILSITAAYAFSFLRNRVNKKQVLLGQDQQINDHVKLKFDQVQVENKFFTFDELMTTQELTQDELFAYAEDSCRESAQEGLALMKRAAQMGHVEAMFTIGQIYRFGNRVGDTPIAKDLPQAITWLEKAATEGNAKACGYLADMYLNGLDVVKDIQKGAKWLLLGFKKGAKTIGITRGHGRIVFANENQAKNYLQEQFGLLKTQLDALNN